MMKSCRHRSWIWRSVSLFGLMLLLSSCATLKSVPLSERPSRDALFERLELSRVAYSSLKGIGKYRFSQQDHSFSATQVVFAQHPDRLRVETLGLFGSSAMMLATDGDFLTVLLPGEGKAYQGGASPGILQQFMQLPLRVEDVVSMLLQHPLLSEWDEDSLRFDPDGNSALILTNAYGMRQEVLFDPQLNIVRFDYFLAEGLQMRLTYDNFDTQTFFPKKLQLQLPLDDLDMSFEFSDVEVNVKHPEDRFVLTPPAGYAIIPLNGGV